MYLDNNTELILRVKCKISFILCEIIPPKLIFLQLCKSGFDSFFLSKPICELTRRIKIVSRLHTVMYVVFLYVLWINIFSFTS